MIASYNKTAISFRDETISYAQLKQNIITIANRIQDTQGGKVVIFAENMPQWIYAFYAAWYNRNIVIPIDFMASAEEVAYILNDCTPDLIFVSREKKQLLDEISDEIHRVVPLIILDDLDFEDTSSAEFKADTNDFLLDYQQDDTAVIIYTSGTTGSPKGVMLSFENILFNIRAVSESVNIYHNDQRVLMLLPLHHIFPLLGTMIAPLSVGASIALSPSLNSEDIKQTLKNNKVTIMIGVPRLYDTIWDGIRRQIERKWITRFIYKTAYTIKSFNLSKIIFKKVQAEFGGHMEYLVCGGAALHVDTGKALRTLGFEVLEGFGMTETAPMISFTRPGNVRVGLPGQIVPGVQVKEIDGELVVKGPNVMQGYYERPQETAQIKRDGWLHTGDLGFVDKDRFIHITGRKKEIIVLSSGKNINPVEIEQKLKKTSPVIAEVGVFLQDGLLQAVIHPDFKAVQEKGLLNLNDYLKSEVLTVYNKSASAYKKIMQIHISKEELPKTRLGKLQRFKLQQMIQNNTSTQSNVKEPDSKEYQIIKSFLTEQTNRPVFPDAHFEIDLGMDSLDKVSLLTFLQNTFGVNISENKLLEHFTVEKISDYVKEKRTRLSVETVHWASILKEKVDINLPRSWFTHNIIKVISGIFMKLYFRIKASGFKNLPSGPFIMAPNHQSFIDGLFVTIYLKRNILKNTYFYAKEKHVRKRWLKFIAHRHNIIIMDLNNDLKLSLQKMASVLDKGKNILIFPEGTRSKDGTLGQFKKTFAILSRELNVPIVPISIKGASGALPAGKIFPRPWKKVSVKFMEPVYPQDYSYETLTGIVSKRLATELN
ncbi:MAG: AMP-binding protein [Caldithrix sp.]|nr:AMP-binding protein [Caldithrix sp.]